MKRELREICDYKFSSLEQNIPQLAKEIPLPFIRRLSNHSLRFMDGYRRGLEGPLLDYVMKKYSSHRSIPPEQIALVKEEFAKKKTKI